MLLISGENVDFVPTSSPHFLCPSLVNQHRYVLVRYAKVPNVTSDGFCESLLLHDSRNQGQVLLGTLVQGELPD